MAGIWGYDWKLRGIIILQNIVIIGLFVGMGWLLDDHFQTKPLWIFLLLAMSFVANQFISIRIIHWYTKNMPKYDPTDEKNQPEEKVKEIL